MLHLHEVGFHAGPVRGYEANYTSAITSISMWDNWGGQKAGNIPFSTFCTHFRGIGVMQWSCSYMHIIIMMHEEDRLYSPNFLYYS